MKTESNPFGDDIRSMLPEELQALAAFSGQPPYRAGQLFARLHKHGAETYDEMTELPPGLRERLALRYPLRALKLMDIAVSRADNAEKYLFAPEKNTIMFETVLMRGGNGVSLCVSTQAGCRMGCRFCASSAYGFQRDLTAGEICAQVYAAGRVNNAAVNRVVLMGCGEPLDNFDNTARFIALISHPRGLNLSRRHIALSTCGLVPQIDRLAELRLQITLAVSLHAPNDDIRRELMPVTNAYPVPEVVGAAKRYAALTHRRVTFEYALIKGVNDSDACAKELAALLKGMLCHVNIIPVNKTAAPFARSGRGQQFSRILAERGIAVTERKSLGADIEAACGQLRGRRMESTPL